MNVRTILAVFVAFEVLYDEDKNPGKGKTRQCWELDDCLTTQCFSR